MRADPPETDVVPVGADLDALMSWRRGQAPPERSDEFRFARALRVIPVGEAAIAEALEAFDITVSEIEVSVAAESFGTPLAASWRAGPDEQTCAVCDWRSICPDAYERYRTTPTAP